MEVSMSLLSYQIADDQISIKAATSIKKDGTYRYRLDSGLGGFPGDILGADKHRKKMNRLADALSEATGNTWSIKDLVYLEHPRKYFGVISDGNLEFAYQYISTLAPGSGQQYYFSPLVSSSRILNSTFDPELAAWMVHSQYQRDYQNIPWEDRKIIVDLFRQGVTADVMDATIVVMR